MAVLISGEDFCLPWDIWDLRLAIDRLRPGTAPGPDGILPEMVQHLGPYMEERLLRIMNRCLEESYFPAEWKAAGLRLIPKSGESDLSIPKSYRPISLLPTLSKVLERLILSAIQTTLEAADHPRQFGSKKGCGTTDAIAKLMEEIESTEEKFAALITFDITSGL